MDEVKDPPIALQMDFELKLKQKVSWKNFLDWKWDQAGYLVPGVYLHVNVKAITSEI